MRLLSVFLFCIIAFQINVFAELSPSSCSLLRTATSITTIVPELAQLAMRYYRVSSPLNSQHHRQKRFLFQDNTSKDGGAVKGSILEQMVANTFKDVNFTKVSLLILNNNDTMTKIRRNVDGHAIIRAAMEKIDYEKLGQSLWYAAGNEFDLEYLISSIINVTHMDIIHEALIINGTLPDWLIKSIHPDINVENIHQIFNLLKNYTNKFTTIMNSSEHLDDYLFNTIQQQILTPLGKIIQRIKNENPTTLDQLVEIILDNVNKAVMEQFSTTTKSITPKKADEKTLKTTTIPIVTVENSTYDDVKLLFYQCSITIDSIGQTARIILKSIEHLYCATIWE